MAMRGGAEKGRAVKPAVTAERMFKRLRFESRGLTGVCLHELYLMLALTPSKGTSEMLYPCPCVQKKRFFSCPKPCHFLKCAEFFHVVLSSVLAL